MRQQFTIFFLAFAVLFSNVHVATPSHDHAELTQVVAHDDHHEDADEQASATDAPSDDAGVSTEIAHQHFTPAGLEASGVELNLSASADSSMLVPARVGQLTSHSRAPPTQPPSA